MSVIKVIQDGETYVVRVPQPAAANIVASSFSLTAEQIEAIQFIIENKLILQQIIQGYTS